MIKSREGTEFTTQSKQKIEETRSKDFQFSEVIWTERKQTGVTHKSFTDLCLASFKLASKHPTQFETPLFHLLQLRKCASFNNGITHHCFA